MPLVTTTIYFILHLYREVQSSLEDPIAEMLLDNEVLIGDTIKIDFQKGKIKITTTAKETFQKDSNQASL